MSATSIVSDYIRISAIEDILEVFLKRGGIGAVNESGFV